jgi:hypothetical protein
MLIEAMRRVLPAVVQMRHVKKWKFICVIIH